MFFFMVLYRKETKPCRLNNPQRKKTGHTLNLFLFFFKKKVVRDRTETILSVLNYWF